MRRAARTDSGHAELLTVLRELGYTVHDTHTVGHGFPDAVAGRNGLTILVEIIGTDDYPHAIGEHDKRRSGWKGGPWIVARDVDELLRELRWAEGAMG